VVVLALIMDAAMRSVVRLATPKGLSGGSP
jgi:hypothetical protein